MNTLKSFLLLFILLFSVTSLVLVGCDGGGDDDNNDTEQTDDDAIVNDDEDSKEPKIYFKFNGVGVWMYCDMDEKPCQTLPDWIEVKENKKTVTISPGFYSVFNGEYGEGSAPSAQYKQLEAQKCKNEDRYYDFDRDSFSQNIIVSDSWCGSESKAIYLKFEGVGMWAYCDMKSSTSDCQNGKGWTGATSGETVRINASDYIIWNAESDDVYETYSTFTAESCDSQDRNYTIKRESFFEEIAVSDSGCQTD